MHQHRQLPNEVVALILSHLTVSDDLYHCALVNKTFQSQVIPLLWRNPAKSQNNYELALPLLNGVQSSQRHLGHFIRRLEFTRDDPASTIVSLLAYTPLIEDLELKEIRLAASDPYLTQLFFLTPQLKTLNLFLLTMNNTAIASLGKSCLHLEKLTLNACSGFSGYSLDPLVSLPALTSLTLTNVYSWSSAPSALGSFPHLTKLELSDCHDITASIIRECHLPQLVKCRIVRCNVDFSTHPNALLDFMHAHPRLETVKLEHCKVDDRALSRLARYSPRLSHFDLACNGHPISSFTVRQFVHACLSLTFLGLDFCGLSASGFPESVQNVSVMGNLDRNDIARIRQGPEDLVFEEEPVRQMEEDEDALFMGGLSLENVW